VNQSRGESGSWLTVNTRHHSSVMNYTHLKKRFGLCGRYVVCLYHKQTLINHVCFNVLRFVWIGNGYVVKLQAIFTTKLVLYLNILNTHTQ
jgi:hypothetical protein